MPYLLTSKKLSELTVREVLEELLPLILAETNKYQEGKEKEKHSRDCGTDRSEIRAADDAGKRREAEKPPTDPAPKPDEPPAAAQPVTKPELPKADWVGFSDIWYRADKKDEGIRFAETLPAFWIDKTIAIINDGVIPDIPIEGRREMVKEWIEREWVEKPIPN